MTRPLFFPEHSNRRQNFWLCCLLLACLLGLQLHAPSHALSHANASGEVALLPWDNNANNSADSSTDQKTADSAHGHSPVSDCCPAGLLAISQSTPAPAVYPLASPALNSTPPLLADSPVFAPYHSRAPPV